MNSGGVRTWIGQWDRRNTRGRIHGLGFDRLSPPLNRVGALTKPNTKKISWARRKSGATAVENDKQAEKLEPATQGGALE
jgi:hypothetical protein